MRELHEETGLDVVEPRYLGSQPWPFPRSLMLGFEARADRDQTLDFLDGEITEAVGSTATRSSPRWTAATSGCAVSRTEPVTGRRPVGPAASTRLDLHRPRTRFRLGASLIRSDSSR